MTNGGPACRFGVKSGKTLTEQKTSTQTPKADVCAIMSTRPSSTESESRDPKAVGIS